MWSSFWGPLYNERLALFGGRLDIESAPGLGTRAVICIPRKLFLDGEEQRTLDGINSELLYE